MKKIIVLLIFVSLPVFAMEDIATLGQSVSQMISQNLKTFYDTYYSSTRTTQELMKAIDQDLQNTHFKTFPLEIRQELIKYVATDEFKRIFYQLVPTETTPIRIRLRTASPEYAYINFLLKLGVNPNILITKNQTALDVVHDLLLSTSLQALFVQYNSIKKLLESFGGKRFGAQ